MNADNQLIVELGDRSYPIHIGEGLLQMSGVFAPYIKGEQVLVVTNETVAPLYLGLIEKNLSR